MGMNVLIAPYRDEILAISLRHGVENVRVFGSVVRGEAGPDSDVDVVTVNGLNAQIRDQVLNEAIAL